MSRNCLQRRGSGQRRVAAAATVLLAVVALTGCGGSAAKPAKAPSPAISAATGHTGPFGPTGRSAAIRSCLEAHGIRPPKSQPNSQSMQEPKLRLPPGVSRAEAEADLRKCGIELPHRPTPQQLLQGPQVVARLDAFAKCMRRHGMRLPKPNTSGNGPIFNVPAALIESAAFQLAETVCRPLLPPRLFPQGPG
jgi:hypothetical protein